MTKSACLEIHQINVSQGDSVLIINRDLGRVRESLRKADVMVSGDPIDFVPQAVQERVDLKGTVKHALLIDGGDDGYGGDVYEYLVQHGVVNPAVKLQPNLAVLISHYHDDHQAGLRYLFKQRVEPVRPNEVVTYAARIRPGVIYQAALDGDTDSTSYAGLWLQQDILDALGARLRPSAIVKVSPGGRDPNGDRVIISLGAAGNDLAINIHLLASSQYIYYPPPPYRRIVPVKPVGKPDQNDRSLVAVLEYGSFRCFLGGDIGGNGREAGGNVGDNAMAPKTRSAHADVESILRPALEMTFPATREWKKGEPKFPNAGYCTVMKADHHGSSSSNDVYLFSAIQPLLFLISSGIKPVPYGHPTQQVLDRASKTITPKWGRPGGPPAGEVNNSIDQVYITEVAARARDQAVQRDLRGARVMGDIVVRPVDETVKAVQDAEARGEVLTVQVYGTGARTGLLDLRSKLRPMTRIRTDPVNRPYYPIGPWEHSDVH